MHFIHTIEFEILFALAMSVLGAGAANASLIYASVTGTSIVNGSGPNYFDLANGLVPSSSVYLNTTPGTTMTIAVAPFEIGH